MVPCGIPGCQVTSLERETGNVLALTEVADVLAADLARAFGLRLAPDPR
jgi:lipoate-protein ligase B